MSSHNEKLLQIFRTAVECNTCFENTALMRSAIDLPQPRLIGQNYWSSGKRVLIVLINPGSGAGRKDGADRVHRDLIASFRSGTGTIEEIFQHQRDDIVNWSRFVSFFINRLGLDLSELALANIAWCGTKSNSYPAKMLNECFALHTAGLVRALEPEIILLSGTRVHAFQRELRIIAPSARLVMCGFRRCEWTVPTRCE
jgi:hypothetical protein